MVGFAYGDEARRCVRVGRVVVGVVFLAKRVKLPFDVRGAGRVGELQGLIVIGQGVGRAVRGRVEG